MKGIQKNVHLVIAPIAFSWRHAGADQVRALVEADEDGIEVFIVVAQIGLRALADGVSVPRQVLNEPGDFRQFSLRSSIRAHVQEVFEQGGTVHSRNDQCGTDIADPILSVSRSGRGAGKQES